MASGGSDRQTGTVPKTKARNNCNVPQEVVTPTRRDIHSTNIMTTSMDWLPVSEHNTRQSQNRSRKSTNISNDNDFAELDSNITIEGGGSRFVPVRPQPRTLVLRQREGAPDGTEDGAPYGSTAILGAHSPHTSHAAIMIVNPTTPNSNQNMNSGGSSARNNVRGPSVGREAYTSGTGPGHHPKPTNLPHEIHDSVYQNGTGHNYVNDNIGHNQQMEHMLPRTEAARSVGDSMVAACPDSARVEQRLGQIREYIRVTSTLVDSMRNSEDEEAIHRPPSAQSSLSAYSDNDLWQNELKANMEMSQLKLAAALQEQKRLLKYQAEAKEQLAEIHLARNGHADLSGSSAGDHHDQHGHPGQSAYPGQYGAHSQPGVLAGRVYGTNQIGVATTLPHVTQHNNNYNWNNQGARKRVSTSRERESTMREPSEGRAKSGPSEQAEIDMLRDLQMRRQHLESQFQSSQVAKIQNLHAATSSLADAVSCPPSEGAGGTAGGAGVTGGTAGGWGGSEASEEEGGTIENTIRNKVAAVNVMKVELERLKSMLRTVDSIQNNFGINSAFDDENIYDNTHLQIQQENQNRNRNRISESSVNNIPLCRTDSSSSSKIMKDTQSASQNSGANSKNQNTPLGLSRLQNCISSGSNKCTNVSEQNQSAVDSVGTGLAAIQQLTHDLKQAAQGLSEERRRLKHATNRDMCTSSGSSIKSEDKKRTNSVGGGGGTGVAPGYGVYSGPMERRQLALKAELEAKKKQLERLMSKDVDHRTNQQCQALEASGPSSKASPPGAEEAAAPPPVPAQDDCACSALTMRTDIDNGYSSDQDDDEAYMSSSRNQLNINQMSAGPSHKLPSRGSSIDNFKDTSYFGDSTQSLDGSFVSQSVKRNKGRANMPVGNKQHNPGLEEAPGPHLGEAPVPAPALPDCFLTLPVSNNGGTLTRNKDPCDVSNMSRASSETSSSGEREPPPPPMAALPPRPHPPTHRHLTKANHTQQPLYNSNPDMTPPQWQNPHAESQMTMWWHNKANQLQQQLEMTSSLCQSLLQDKRAGQGTPSTLGGPPLTGYGPPPGMELQALLGGQLWAQQQQLAAAAWGSAHCIQHLLSQQREISSLRSTVSNLEEKLQTLNLTMPRAHSTPPHGHFPEPAPRSGSALSQYWASPDLPPGLAQRMPKVPPFPHLPPTQQGEEARGPACPPHLTPHAAPAGTQTLSGQSAALNNQVPPGNRANNYWDNFRSYSRQNLLSGNSKSNTDPALPGHSAHPPLAERSHNSLAGAGAPPSHTPKRNVNAPAPFHSQPEPALGADRARGRRNLSQETEYFTAPPDVLNVNQNVDSEPNQLLNFLSSTEESPVVNRYSSSVNVNLNRLSTNPIPEIIQAHSNNLNVPRSNGAHKKKSSSKLPAKNASNPGNYSSDYAHHRNVEVNTGNEVFNPNLASTSSSNIQEKSTTKLFDLLRENVYSEVTALISANESRPHFLIQLFRDLQQISSDTLRQRALQSIQECVTQYLSAAEAESYDINENRNVRRNQPITGDNPGASGDAQSNNTVILALDVDNEILRFILSHHSDICSDELLDSLRHVVISTIGNHNDQSIIDQNLRECLVKFRGCKLEDISDDLVITIIRIISVVDTKGHQGTNTATESSSNTAEPTHSNERHGASSLAYQENSPNERQHYVQHFENPEMEMSGNHMEGLACAAGIMGEQNEATGYSACSSAHESANRFVSMPESKIDLIESVETYNGDLAEADQSRHGTEAAAPAEGTLEGTLPDVVDTEEQTPTEAEAEWLGLDRVPTRLQMEDNPGNQSGEY